MGWKNYKYRFLPWLLFNMRNRLTTLQKKTQNDLSLSPVQLNASLTKILSKLHPELNFEANSSILSSQFGYELCVSGSKEGKGCGVFLSSGSVHPGQIVGLYPGSIYHPGDPILIPSLFNPYILQLSDGVMIDGRSHGLSGSIFKSIAYRDRYPDMTWLRHPTRPSNPLSLGQLISNGGSKGFNVTYAECCWDLRGSHRLNQLIPNAPYDPNHELVIRVVPIVAIRDISCGEELLSSYFSIV
uniref:C5orf35 n=1 Tax=Caligus rogercresseyi TaxID=217165 RepID=C1BNP1_CALRO|nr:C5orf35 [Caligus rogercresseyi]